MIHVNIAHPMQHNWNHIRIDALNESKNDRSFLNNPTIKIWDFFLKVIQSFGNVENWVDSDSLQF